MTTFEVQQRVVDGIDTAINRPIFHPSAQDTLLLRAVQQVFRENWGGICDHVASMTSQTEEKG